jgi:hypothetical protein
VSSNLTASAKISMNTGLSGLFSFLPAKDPAKNIKLHFLGRFRCQSTSEIRAADVSIHGPSNS